MLANTLGSAQRFKKRERTQNWAYEEKRFLLELCRKDMHIIENKRLDSALTSLKNRAWKIIHQQFAIAFGTDRNCNRLKEQWRRMKACTRAEMQDYQQRLVRFGQEMADRKKPSQFTFEIWEFMQEAKKVCKNELMDDVDYSKMKLSLEENLPQGISIKECSDENDEESSPLWDKSTHNLCEVQIKEDSMDEGDDYEKSRQAKFPRLSGLPSSSPYTVEQAHTKFSEMLTSSIASRLNEHISNNNNTTSVDMENYVRTFGSDPNLSEVPVNMSQNDITTLQALSILKNRINRFNELGQWKNVFNEVQNLNATSNSQSEHQSHQTTHQPQIPHPQQTALEPSSSPIPPSASATIGSQQRPKLTEEHQQREHELRMEILKTELETAKINKETAEISRQIALQKLSSLNS